MTDIRPIVLNQSERGPSILYSPIFPELAAVLPRISPSQNNKAIEGLNRNSIFNWPITNRALSGNTRRWGDADLAVQLEVMKKVLSYSRELPLEDRALLLAIVRVESGFNPDAAARSSSAAGIFQIIRGNWENLSLRPQTVFDVDQNILAGIRLFKENIRLLDRRNPTLSGDDRLALLYALHHDGPSLNAGGETIARKEILPYMDRFRRISRFLADNV